MRRPLLNVCICLFIFVALWMQKTASPPLAGDCTGWEGKQVLLMGQVYQKEYRMYYGEELLILYLDTVFYSEETLLSEETNSKFSKRLSEINPREKIICELNISELPEGGFIPKLGNKVVLQGTWQSFVHATNPGEFDGADYYAILGIGARIEEGKLEAVSEEYWPLREKLYQVKQVLLRNLYEAFEPREASILAKMLLGDGSGLDKEVRDLYQRNGIVHILSISGLHITLLGMGLYKGLRKLTCPMSVAAVLGGISILLYGMMTGFGISACRAIGMYLIHMIGELWGKTYDMLTAMGMLAVFLVYRNPYFVYHSGFLLSFFSVCGVGMLSPLLQLPQEWFRKRPGEGKGTYIWRKLLQKLTGGMSVSLAVTLFTLPIQLFFFYKIPVYSVIINLFVIPFMSVVMVLGICVMLCPSLQGLVFVEEWIFTWFEWLCHAFDRLPGHTWVTGRPEMWRILIYYLVLIIVLLFTKKVKRGYSLVGILVAVVLVGGRSGQSLEITFLDVGQGDCICVQTPEGKCFLFDGGSSSKQQLGEKILQPFLYYQGMDYVDAVFLSHPDRDHHSGLLELLTEKEIEIGAMYLPDVGAACKEDFEEILERVEPEKVHWIASGDRWQQEQWKLTCLHPYKGYEAEKNTYSACYLLEYGEFSLLLTGDVDGQGEELLRQELRRRGIDEIDVLKVAHHGSRYSSSQAFLEQVSTRLAVISCGRNNSYGHPHKETLVRLSEAGSVILTTPEYGAVMIKVALGGKVSVSYWGIGSVPD
ncbi:MAG: DNA internalization-related competence protein ComEC/Rec2 [Lachnospiraceae bacterium]|nr:DNA internalization-related competence protein ComEC/Rec2 [Lachnospiraceae bacterium]